MKYPLEDKNELNRAFDYLTKLAGQEATVEIKKFVAKRTNQQNRYMWVLFHTFSDETGYEVHESKQIFEEINADIFSYEHKGRAFKRSTTDLTTAEMTTCIDRFIRYAADNGISLPIALNEKDLITLENRYEA